MMTSILELRPALRAGLVYSGRASRSERHFLDFVIDGESLWERVRRPDMVSVFCAEFAAANLKESTKGVRRLMLLEEADAPDGRRSLFICPECGDLGCGAITASIVKEDDSIVWKNFGHAYSEAGTIKTTDSPWVGMFTFDLSAYEEALWQGLAKLPAL